MLDTYNRFIDRINDNFVTPHLQIKKFEEGFYEDMQNFETANEQFPFMWLVPLSVSHLENSVSEYSVRVYFIDILEKDNSNERDILSDQLSISRDFVNWLRLNQDNGFNILNTPSATPVKSVLLDYTCGWYMDLTIEVETEMSDCTIPFTGSSGSTINCPDGTVINSGSTYSVSVPSGSIVQLPNVPNVDSDGSIVLTPAQVAFTATTCTLPSGSTVENSTGSYSVSLSDGSNLVLPNTPIFSTLSGFTDSTPSVSTGYTIPDVVWTDSDSSPMSTEYGQPIVCTPIPTPDNVILSLWSDSGQTTPVISVTYGQTIYGSLTWFSNTPINSIVIHQPIGNDEDYLEVPINVFSPTFSIDVLNVGAQPWYVIMDNGNLVADEYNLTSTGTTPPNLYMVIDIADTSTSAPITIVTGNDGTVTTVDDGGLTSLVISVNASTVTVPFAIVATDSVVFTYDAAVGDTQIILTGTYA